MFEKFEGNLEIIFPKDGKYTFLVGAGASMDAPTSMPSAREIVSTLLNLCAPKEEIERLKSFIKE